MLKGYDKQRRDDQVNVTWEARLEPFLRQFQGARAWRHYNKIVIEIPVKELVR